MRRGLVVAAAVICIGALTGAARAQAPSTSQPADEIARVERLYARGAALYRDGRFRAAIDLFEEAYLIYPEPKLLYNIARAHEALGEPSRAAALYERVLGTKPGDETLRAMARRHLRAIRAREARSAGAEPASQPAASQPAAPQSTPSRPSPNLAPSAAAARSTADAEPAAAGAPSGQSRGWAKWIAGGAGVLLAGGGAVALWLGQQDYARVEEAKSAGAEGIAPMTRVEAQRLVDRGTTKKWIGYGLIAAGGAAVVTSAVLFLLDGRPERNSSLATAGAPDVVVQPTATGATLGVRGAF